MPTNYKAMFTPDLVSKKSPARKAEAQRRLDTQTLSPKNVRRLTAYLAAPAPKAPTAPKVAEPVAPKVGAKGGNPVKAACWEHASMIAASRGIAIRSAEFWPIYKEQTAAARAAGTL